MVTTAILGVLWWRCRHDSVAGEEPDSMVCTALRHQSTLNRSQILLMHKTLTNVMTMTKPLINNEIVVTVSDSEKYRYYRK